MQIVRASLGASLLALLAAVGVGCIGTMGEGQGGSGDGDVPDAGSAEWDDGGASPRGDASPDGDGDGSDDGVDPPPDETPWRPAPHTASRFGVFYQVTGDVLDTYADPALGLPQSAAHVYIFAQSHSSAPADRGFGDRIHAARADFRYAPCFDLNDHPGWSSAPDADIAAMAHEFRDKALVAHADYFCFNEAYSNTGSNETIRVQMMKLLTYLNEPAASGSRLRGIFFLTEAAATPSKWTSPGTAFWQRVNETSDAVVAEHYHGHGFVCQNTDAFLADHLFALRRWFEASGEAAKLEIASKKFVVLHSARYESGTSGWQGADANTTSLAAFQRNLSKLARVTRRTEGGVNRISFAPVATGVTMASVQPRIRQLLRWHYDGSAPYEAERACVSGADVNCQCQ